MPALFAASQIVVPSGAVTSRPSIDSVTVRDSAGASAEIATNDHLLLMDGATRMVSISRRRLPDYSLSGVMPMTTVAVADGNDRRRLVAGRARTSGRVSPPRSSPPSQAQAARASSSVGYAVQVAI